MSTTARKTRKRGGEKFVRIPKIGTPIEERAQNKPYTHKNVTTGEWIFALTAAARKRLAAHKAITES